MTELSPVIQNNFKILDDVFIIQKYFISLHLKLITRQYANDNKEN